ncbi:hypothetical protein [Streptomyces sp. NBC_01190]|uniref:hypothetical protein n=1 Tax=Streptomyces sp. NBC_01190 TaxID=2903767 RepID=UPI003868536C|nr:hypothetical protein OG519_07230 [Streptomyces sp. NBC_01190]
MVESSEERAESGTQAGNKRARWAEGRELRRVGRLARRIEAFSRRHGGGAEASVLYLGERGARIVLVAANGDWGDLVAPSHALAVRAVERAGVPVHEDLTGELAARMRTGGYEWKRMAGIQIGGHANT